MSLEKELGSDLFLAAYHCCRDTADVGCMAAAGGDDAVGDASAQLSAPVADKLLGLLGGRWHLVCQLNRLITWEDATYK